MPLNHATPHHSSEAPPASPSTSSATPDLPAHSRCSPVQLKYQQQREWRPQRFCATRIIGKRFLFSPLLLEYEDISHCRCSRRWSWIRLCGLKPAFAVANPRSLKIAKHKGTSIWLDTGFRKGEWVAISCMIFEGSIADLYSCIRPLPSSALS